jgi:hypothetical protein
MGAVTMHVITELAGLDPRHVFLDCRDVIARYGWGRSKGYQNLKDRDLIPPPLMSHPDRWRLDQLLSWEDRRIEAAVADLTRQPAQILEDLLPPPKRVRPSRRSRAS